MAYETDDKKSSLKSWYHFLIGLLALPYLLLRHAAVRQSFGAALFGDPRDRDTIFLSEPRHRHRINVDVVHTDLSLEQRAGAAALLSELAAAHDWVNLGRQLEFWDSAKTCCADNRRVIHAGLDAAVEALHEGLGPKRCEALDVARIPQATVEDAIACFLEDPSQYGLAGFIVRALLDQCWDLRGQSWAHDVEDDAWEEIADKMATAHTILEEARIDARNSALLFGQRLDTLYFLSESHQRIHSWYEAVVKADPGDSGPHMAMGNMMLPRWFGDYEQMEIAARQAVVWSQEDMGSAAYAILYLRALEMEIEPLYFMDLDLFCESVHDLIRYRECSPVHIAEISEFLFHLSNMAYPDDLDHPEDREMWDATCHTLQMLSFKIVEDYLPAIHAPSWTHGEAGALAMISRAMGQELEDGLNLIVGPKGIRGVAPETTDDSKADLPGDKHL